MTLDQETTARLVSQGLAVLALVVAAWLAVWLAHRIIPRMVRAYLTRLRSLRPAPGGIAAESPEELQKRADTLSRVFVWTFEVMVLATAAVATLGVFGVDTTPAVASLGVIGIAVGFGAQALVKDCINGAFILLEDQYRRGDVVKVAGISGLVEDISLRRTILRDMDGTVHSIPNGEVTISSNLTRDWSRVNLNIPVAYETEVASAIAILNRLGQELAQDAVYGPMILEPPKFLRVDALAETGVELKVLGVTKPIKQWEVMGEYRRRVLAAFTEAGIEIPHPARVMVTKAPPPGAST